MAKPEGVYLFMGVNGVGKSTLTRDIADALPEALAVHASQELRKLFGGITHAQLELLSPEEKLARKVAHLVGLFRHAREAHGLVLVDTHLLVPIRRDGSTRYEDTWSDEYSSYVTGAFMLTANPKEIRARREIDDSATGRARDLTEENIARDQEVNVDAFTALIERGALPANSQVIENRDGLQHQILARMLNQELMLS